MLKSPLFLAIALSAAVLAGPLSAATGAQYPGPGSRMANDADMQAMRNYKLTMSKVDQWAASNRALAAYAKAHPEIKNQKNDFGDAKSFSDMETRARAQAPAFVKAIESSGISFRDWWLVTGSLMSAYVATQYQRPGMPNTVSPENIEFVKANKQKIDGLLAEMQKMKAEANGERDNH